MLFSTLGEQGMKKTHLLHELVVFVRFTGLQGPVALLCAFFLLVLSVT